MKREARLILDNGTVFSGWSFGADVNTVGEVVFNTAMMGYPESLTDPSYAGQILVTTFPLIGNYGVPSTGVGADGLPLFMESDRIHPKGLIVADYSEEYSHWNAKESLSSWLKREGIPAISGIDTRRLTKLLREHGVMRGRIEINSKFKFKPRRGLRKHQLGGVLLNFHFLILNLPYLHFHMKVFLFFYLYS
ncbi:MAG: hypothetical protein J6P55_02345, partial [Bacteroidaceae bacterium]|nr:hypothetical protein [Bacteroidaceae bacterium]